MKNLTSYKKNIFIICTTLAVSCTALSPAFGLDKDTFSKRLNSATNDMMIELSSDNIEVNDNNVVYHDTVVKYKTTDGSKDAKGQINLGDVYFDNIKEEDGHYIVGEARFPDISETNDNVKFDVQGMTFENLILPDETDETYANVGLVYEDMNIKSLTYSLKDKPVFVAKGIESHYSPFNRKTPIEISSKVDNFSFDANATEDAQTIEQMKALGLENLTGSAYSTGTWDAFGTGALNINEYSIKVDKAGTLKGNMSINGITQKVLASIKELQQSSASNDKSGMAAMALMQQIKIKNVKIRYEDAGLVNKLIDFNAKKGSTAPEDLKTLLKQVIPMAAENTQSPEFIEEVKTATNTFIDNPKSLEISAQPKDEISITALAVAAAMGAKAPANIINLLNIHLVANK